jgi:hypothetical protein
MSELILTTKGEYIPTVVIFRGDVTKAVIRAFETPLNEENNASKFQLMLYHNNTQIYNRKFPFLPEHLMKQIRKVKIEVVEVYERDLTVNESQDLYDLSK